MVTFREEQLVNCAVVMGLTVSQTRLLPAIVDRACSKYKVRFENLTSQIMRDVLLREGLKDIVFEVEKGMRESESQNEWNVLLGDTVIDTVFYNFGMDKDEVKQSLIKDGFPSSIEVYLS